MENLVIKIFLVKEVSYYFIYFSFDYFSNLFIEFLINLDDQEEEEDFGDEEGLEDGEDFDGKNQLWEEDDGTDKPITPWQKQASRIENQIKSLEEQNTTERPWVLKGEVSS